MTGTTVITNRARYILSDTTTGATERWSDAILMVWLNEGGALIANYRPDSLFTAPYTQAAWADIAAIGNTVSIGDKFQGALVDFICSRALAQDSQDERDLKRSVTYFQQFVAKAGLPANVVTMAGRKV